MRPSASSISVLTFDRCLRLFMPMHYLGLAGALRRYAQLTEFNFLKPMQPLMCSSRSQHL